jgi:integrase
MQRLTFASFAGEVLGLYAPPVRRIATYRKMAQVLEEFAPYCNRLADLKPETIARWVRDHADRRPASLDSHLRSLRAACNYAVGAGYLKVSPFAFRSPRRWVDWDVPELPPPVHGGEDIARVLELADVEAAGGSWHACRLRAVVYTAAYTGARRREILGLAVADVHLDRGLLSIRTNGRRCLKTRGSAAQIPAAQPLADVLGEWVPQCGSTWLFPGVRKVGPWLEGSKGYKALDQLKALGERAGVKGLTFQSFRHSFASLSEGWGIGELALQRVLRHTSLRTQRDYRHELPEVLKDVASKVHFP